MISYLIPVVSPKAIFMSNTESVDYYRIGSYTFERVLGWEEELEGEEEVGIRQIEH